MNAPSHPAITADAPDLRIVRRSDCIPSRTNPRRRRGLDVASLTALAKTMAPPIGILEPLVGRELPDGLIEIACGERRWRSAEIAALDSIPILVRKLTDLEVLSIQLIENGQREDLDALEEAEGYEKLMQQKDADGKPYTAELIAELMGVSKATIYARLKLLALCQAARDAFFDDKIDASTALLIARIPVEKLQLQALKKVTEPIGYGNQFIAIGAGVGRESQA